VYSLKAILFESSRDKSKGRKEDSFNLSLYIRVSSWISYNIRYLCSINFIL
jgi:SET domain-containing protein